MGILVEEGMIALWFLTRALGWISKDVEASARNKLNSEL
jgi:hypothetical protein